VDERADPDPARELDRVRGELRRLGYLSDRFDRFLLQDALRPRGAGRSLAGLALRVGLLAGVGVALVLVLALAAANDLLTTSPFDLAALFAHVALPVAAASCLAFVVLAGLLAALLRLYPARRIEGLSLGVALAAGAAVAALAAARLHEAAGGPGGWAAAVGAALAAALLVAGVVRVVHGGLLGLAIRLTDTPPRTRARPGRWPLVALAAALALVLVLLPALLAVGPGPPPAPPALPTAPGDRVLLVGVDGVLPGELDYLLERGDLPALRALLGDGGRLLAYRRPPGPPAAFWTTVATGRPAPEHGVSAVDSFRPLGVSAPLARSGPFRALWRAEAAVGLAEYRPLLAARRTAFTVWELAARGGSTAVVVDWWSTFPADPVPGLVVSHGAYQLLGEGVDGAVAPAAAEEELADLRRRVAAAPPPAPAGALPPALAARVADTALRPDRFYRQAALRGVETAAQPPRIAALYLPGIDVAAEGWDGTELAFADLVRRELARTDRAVRRAAAAQGPGTIAVVVDPGRRGRGDAAGRVLLWRRQGCRTGTAGGLAPAQVAAGLLAALGLPASEELPPPPAACPWPAPPARLASYGSREPARRDAGDAREYLESLRSLGYL